MEYTLRKIYQINGIIFFLQGYKQTLLYPIHLLSKYCDNKLKNIQEKVAKIYEDGQLKTFETEE